MFEEKMKRLFIAARVKSDTELAEILNIKPPSVAGARKRQTVPGDWIEKIAKSYFISADWLLFGRGSMHPAETPQTLKTQTEMPTLRHEVVVSCARCNELKAELELEKVERRGLSDENRELNAENRKLLKENGDLRERCAKLEVR